MRKGQKKQKWPAEQKLEIVYKHLDEHLSVKKLEKEYEVEHRTICRWTKEYLAGGAAAFEPKPRLCAIAGHMPAVFSPAFRRKSTV